MKILYNARIYTQDPRKPWASALAIDSGWIVASGEDHEILAEFRESSHTEYQNLEGRPVIPGLTDAHLHLQHFALGRQKIDCETAARQECLARVAERAQKTPAGQWVLGHGWNHNQWDGVFGTAAELDSAAPDHPVYLTAKSLHAAWANTAALRLAGLDDQSADPPGGKLGRTPDGKLDGILLESAMALVGDVVPDPSFYQTLQAIREAIPVLWSYGLTGVHDFDRRECFAALQVLRLQNELRLRVVKSIPVDDLPHAAELGLRGGFGDDLLRIGSVKLFADGALGPHTAAMLQPYEDDPQNRGMLLMDAEELFEIGSQAVRTGLGIAVHAIGDRANHEVLNAIAQLRELEKAEGLAAPRHRIEHVQVIHPDDAGRLADLGVIASMQPIHATSDMLMADRFWGKRSALAYAWQTQLSRGATLAFGSDAPVESPNPFLGLHAAVTRQRADGSPGEAGWYPEQRLALPEALAGFTTGAAYAAGMEDRLGRLAPGYLADLLVLDHDLFQMEPAHIKDMRPSKTMVGGEWVYQA